MEVERRRYQNYLQCSGIAVILFGIWDIIKGFTFFISNLSTWILEQPEETQVIMSSPLAKIISIIMMGIFSLIIFMFHYWLGRGAISENRGKRLRRPYVAAAVIWAVLCAVNIFFTIRTAFSEDEGDALSFNTIIFDFTFILIVVEMTHAAWKIRRLTQQSEKEGA